jgi:opacity protein-like surface antigen
MASLTGGSAVAQDMFDWSGLYVGGAVGVVQSDSSADISYGTDADAGWSASDGYFTGDIYDDVDNSWIDFEANDAGTDDEYEIDLGELTPWLTEIDLTGLSWAGTGLAGAQVQMGAFVLGGELRGAFGDFGHSYAEAGPDGTSDWGAVTWDPEGGTLTAGLPDASGDLWWGDDAVSEPLDPAGAEIHGTVDQYNSLAFGTSYNSYFTPTAKLGVAADRFMLFALAGPAVAQVTATTSASVVETGHVGVENGGNSVADVDGIASYDWSGENTETLWGYTVGAGVEYAATDNIILRLEASMTDLGTIDVTGQSDDTGAEYTVTQTVANFALQTGVTFKF